jgi:capsular polysaccharide biosynthesis protein
MHENTAPGNEDPTSASGAIEGRTRSTGPFADRSETGHRTWPSSQSNRHRAWQFILLLILPVLIAASAAFVVASQSQRVYAGRSEIVLDLRNLGWDTAERFIGTELAVAESRAVLAPVAEKFGVLVRDMERRLSAEPIRNSSIVRLQYEDPDPARALEITIAVTERYLSVLQELASQEDIRLRVLTPPFLLEEPVSPEPLRAAAVGAVVGMALAIIGIILWVQPWRTNHHA